MSGHNLSLPRHRYVFVRSDMVWDPEDPTPVPALLPAVWFGVGVTPGRVMGCHVLLESGAVVVDLPLQALWAHDTLPANGLPPAAVPAVWDMYGWRAEVYAPEFLVDAEVELLSDQHEPLHERGRLWFAIDFLDDGYAMAPGQHKHLWVVATHDGPLVQVPQDMLLVHDRSFTVIGDVPRIRRQTLVYRAES
jgi:hypothetical protein